jgi:hypothetical protein
MRKTVFAAAFAAAALLFASPQVTSPAAAAPNAKSGHASHGAHHASSGQRRHFDRHPSRRHGWHHRGGPRFGVYIGRGYGYAGRSCAWLRAKAIQTGSRYWWRRYRECRY